MFEINKILKDLSDNELEELYNTCFISLNRENPVAQILDRLPPSNHGNLYLAIQFEMNDRKMNQVKAVKKPNHPTFGDGKVIRKKLPKPDGYYDVD